MVKFVLGLGVLALIIGCLIALAPPATNSLPAANAAAANAIQDKGRLANELGNEPAESSNALTDEDNEICEHPEYPDC